MEVSSSVTLDEHELYIDVAVHRRCSECSVQMCSDDELYIVDAQTYVVYIDRWLRRTDDHKLESQLTLFRLSCDLLEGEQNQPNHHQTLGKPDQNLLRIDLALLLG